MGFYDSFGNEIVYAFYVPQVKPQPQPVAPDAEVEEQPQREDDAENHVQPFAVEGTCVGTGVDDWVFVDIHEHNVVATVVEFFDERFQTVAELCCMAVLAGAEEDVDVVRDAAQAHCPSALGAESREFAKALRQSRIVGVVENHVLAVQLAAGTKSEQLHEEVTIALHVEDHTVAVRLVRKEDTGGEEHKRAEPCAALYRPCINLCVVHARLVHDIIKDEDDDTDHNRHPQASLTDNCPQRCADEEEEQAGQTHRVLLVPLYAVLAEGEVPVACLEGSELTFRLCAFGTALCSAPSLNALVVLQGKIERVEGRHQLRLLHDAKGVGKPSGDVLSQIAEHEIVADDAASAIYAVAQRINAVLYFAKVLGLGVVREEVSVHEVEVAIKGDEVHLAYERLSHVGHVCPEHRSLLGIHVAEAFPTPERELEVHLVGCALHPSAVGKDNLRVVVTVGVGVNHHAIEHTRFRVFMLNIEVVARYLAVKNAFGDFQFRTLLPHAPGKSRQLAGGIGADFVLKPKAAAADDRRHDDEGGEDANKRNAGGLHAEQFEALAQVAEGNKACKQDCQRNGHRYERQATVPEELSKEVDSKALADEVAHPFPQELHDEDEEADEESARKELQESLDDVNVELLDNLHSSCAHLVRKGTK